MLCFGVLCCAVVLQVHGPFDMLNIIHFIVFRITRTVLYSLECVLAGDPAQTVSVVATRRLAAATSCQLPYLSDL